MGSGSGLERRWVGFGETGFGLWVDGFREVGDGNSEFDSGVGLMDWEIGFGLVFSGGVELGVGFQ